METIHILGAAILVGVVLGSTVYMRVARRAGNPAGVVQAATGTIRADLFFVLPAGLVQPATGIHEAVEHGLPLTTGWVGLSLLLYLVAATAWVGSLRTAYRLRAQCAAAEDPHAIPMPAMRRFGLWQALRGAVLLVLLVIFYMMINHSGLQVIF